MGDMGKLDFCNGYSDGWPLHVRSPSSKPS